MNVDDAFPSPYLAASDLNGADMTVTLGNVEMVEFQDEPAPRPVLMFAGDVKPMRLNQVNAATIVGLTHTKEMNEWVGRQITLFPTTCLFRGEIKACIRVRANPPNGQPQPAAEQPATPEQAGVYGVRIDIATTTEELNMVEREAFAAQTQGLITEEHLGSLLNDCAAKRVQFTRQTSG
jgi:hypothetical protein